MIESFAYMVVSTILPVGGGEETDGRVGLSPSVHTIDQIKIIDRFRGSFSSSFVATIMTDKVVDRNPT